MKILKSPDGTFPVNFGNQLQKIKRQFPLNKNPGKAENFSGIHKPIISRFYFR